MIMLTLIVISELFFCDHTPTSITWRPGSHGDQILSAPISFQLWQMEEGGLLQTFDLELMNI